MNKGIHYAVIMLVAAFITSCNPDAKWETKDVTIDINPYTVSAGYIECSFTPDKDAYYLVACEPVRPGYNPADPNNQKQFMTLALDSANLEYLEWRNWRLTEKGDFNIAPFASHCLQYGAIDHYFTNLTPNTDYWVYAFVVDPDKLQPAGRLYLKTLTTTQTSMVDVHFEYRVRGMWDYIYPLNPDGKINNHFPYLAGTCDSLYLADEVKMTPEEYFAGYFLMISAMDATYAVRYGVQVVYNDGLSSDEMFEEGHTYYTAIVSFDGFIGNNVIYKFTWTGDDFEAYFKDEDSIVEVN